MTAPYQLLPALAADERSELHADIEEHGVQIPVIVDEDGNVIDGHHRQAIAGELDIPCPRIVVTGYTDAEKRGMALRLNLHRRALTREQKRELIAASLKADPQLSNRQHAERTDSDHKTVGTARQGLESTGEIPQSDTRQSADGRERPASQPSRFTKVRNEALVDTDTGEVVDTNAPAAGPAAIVEPEPTPDPAAAAVEDFVNNDEMKRLNYQAAFARSLKNVSALAAQFSVADVAELVDHSQIESLTEVVKSLNNFVANVRKQRGNILRLVNR